LQWGQISTLYIGIDIEAGMNKNVEINERYADFEAKLKKSM
jgi:hypothetical protein